MIKSMGSFHASPSGTATNAALPIAEPPELSTAPGRALPVPTAEAGGLPALLARPGRQQAVERLTRCKPM